jgi:transcriptional regulator with XRE-family HTH domain
MTVGHLTQPKGENCCQLSPFLAKSNYWQQHRTADQGNTPGILNLVGANHLRKIIIQRRCTMNTVDILVGKRIRARRLAIGMSQAELGQAIGVRFQQVQKYESALNRVSASRLWAIANILGVEVVQFFAGIQPYTKDKVGTNAKPLDFGTHLSDPELLELVELYSVLPTVHKQAVLAMIRSMGQSELAVRSGFAGKRSA